MNERAVILAPGESRLVSVAGLLTQRFVIPRFQRPFDWEASQVADFIRDLADAQAKGSPLFLGLVVAHCADNGQLAIIDGQQRLTTLMLALAIKVGSERVLLEGGPIRSLWITPRESDVAFTRALVKAQSEPPATLSQWLMASARQQLGEADISVDALLRCEIILYLAPNLAGATRLFERINLRGKKVSEFDLVKNKLIEWVAAVPDEHQRELEAFIAGRYDHMYQLLDPKAADTAYNSDKLLRTHWIMFSDVQFRSGERVLEKIEERLKQVHADVAVSAWIESYLDSLVQVAAIWVWIERPFHVDRPAYGQLLRSALLDFAKLGREAELQPLIAAALLRFGSKATPLIRFCEIASIRAALAKRNSNNGRSIKWRLARQLFSATLVDAKGKPISTPEEVVHQLFWLNTPYWSKAEANEFEDPFTEEDLASSVVPEDALDARDFLTQYGTLVHYLFWKYGVYLLSSKEWSSRVKVDISPFQESVWFQGEKSSFSNWDIEHIYPRNPDEADSRKVQDFRKKMRAWLNHLGNLTVLPIRDNRGMHNAVFEKKLEWMAEQKKVSFNELLRHRAYTGNMMDGPYWGPNNCKKRVEQIKAFAGEVWGTAAIRMLGVCDEDERIAGFEEEESDEDE